MEFPFFSGKRKLGDTLIVIDLGGRTTKAVQVQRKGGGFSLLSYAVQDAPIADKAPSPELLSEHFKAVAQTLEARTKQVVFSVGVADSVLRHAELPLLPPDDMRMVLKFNSKNYLQQDLPDYAFDCFALPGAANGAKPGETAAKSQKVRVLVGGAKNQLVNDLQAAAKLAGWSAEFVSPALVGPANAFELAQPEVFRKQVVALIEMGFRNTTITILKDGEFMLSRVVNLGGDKLTQGLAEAMNISYAEAEGIKVGMPDEVKPTLQLLVSPLARELRASIDYFEHQHDRAVAEAYVSGGAARSACLVALLQEELMVPCKTWSPVSFMNQSMPPRQLAEIEQVAAQLSVAVGTAAGAY
jgi:type IV pilus assembly protein PilM